MGFFIGLVIALAAIGGVIWAAHSVDNDSIVTAIIAIVLVAACAIAFVIVPWSFHTIESGEVAVVKHFGEAKEVKQPGLNYDFWGTNKYVFLDCKVQTLDIQTLSYSSDAQTMDILANVQFQILPDKALDIVKTYLHAHSPILVYLHPAFYVHLQDIRMQLWIMHSYSVDIEEVLLICHQMGFHPIVL